MDFHLVCQSPALARRLARRGGKELTQKKTEGKEGGKVVFSDYLRFSAILSSNGVEQEEEGEFFNRFP